MQNAVAPKRLVFVQISDIHFKDDSDSAHDVDKDVRRSLIDDVEEQIRGIGQLDAILVSGDISFSGKEAQFQHAKDWLREIGERLHVKPADIWVVPGNHDVDRDKHEDLHKTLVGSLRAKTGAHLGDAIKKTTEQPMSSGMLFAPLSAYNLFAQSFQSETRAECIAWSTPYSLDPPYTCTVVGLNTALFCNAADNQGNILVGLQQCQFMNGQNAEKRGEVHLVLCHHPSDWWLDHSAVVAHVNRARIILHGHKHVRRLTKVDNTVVVACGAVNPDRNEENWRPGYNIVEVSVIPNGTRHQLRVGVRPRAWHITAYGVDASTEGAQERVFMLDLPELEPATAAYRRSAPVAAVPEAPATDAPQVAKDPTPSDFTAGARNIRFEFSELPFDVQMEIFAKLNLIEVSERDLPDTDRSTRAIMRAYKQDQLRTLKKEMDDFLAKDQHNP